MGELEIPKARVFISCGQRRGEEEDAARKVAAVLSELGFESYIAVQEATLVGLKENVYRQLEESEYILFIDFMRDQLANLAEFRGSLFSHQELAVAAYLDLEWRPFQQVGVERNGIMSFTQSNAVRFSSPSELPELVKKHVVARGWRSDWKNSLEITGPIRSVDTQVQGPSPQMARFFHLKVQNLNPRKYALNCTAYIERVRNRVTGDEVPLKVVEIRWAGFDRPEATVFPGNSRPLDAGFVFHHRPEILYFNSFSTSTEFMSPLQGPGEFLLDYLVVGQGFQPARRTVCVKLDNELGKVEVVL